LPRRSCPAVITGIYLSRIQSVRSSRASAGTLRHHDRVRRDLRCTLRPPRRVIRPYPGRSRQRRREETAPDRGNREVSTRKLLFSWRSGKSVSWRGPNHQSLSEKRGLLSATANE